MSLLVAGVMIVPTAILWTLGAFHHDSVTWLFSSNIGFEVHSTSSLPLLDGVLGSLLFGGLSGIAKGLLVFGLAVIALAVIKRCWALPRDHETKWYSIGIALAVLLLILVLNEREIWASVRFGRLLAVPLTILFGTMVIDAVKTRQAAIYGVSLAVLGLFLSQVAFGYYLTRIWTLSL